MSVIEIEPGQKLPLTTEQSLSQMDLDEVEIMEGVQSPDLSQYEKSPGLGKFFGQGFTDGIVQQGIGTMTTLQGLYGKIEDDKKGGLEEGFRSRVAQKLRNIELAAREKLALAPEDVEVPETFPEKVAQGLGNGLASMIGTISGGIAGGVAGTAVAGPPGTVVGAATGAFSVSYLNEKAAMAQTLIDAGYDAEYVDRVSDFYAMPVAALDVVSLGFLSQIARPVVATAVKTTIGKGLLQGTLRFGKQAAKAGLSEGVTEGIQGQIQSEFEIAHGIKMRDFEDDLTSRAVEFSVGLIIGTGAAATGQLNSRRRTIKDLSTKYNVPSENMAKIVDDAFLRANDVMLDEIVKQADIAPEMLRLEKAFSKVEGRPEIDPQQVLEAEAAPTQQEFIESKEIENLEQQLAEAEVRPPLNREQFNEVKGREPKSVEEFNAWKEAQEKKQDRQIKRLTREVEDVKKIKALETELALPSERTRATKVKQVARHTLRKVNTAFKVGRQSTTAEMKTIQKSLLTLQRDVKLTDKATKKLFRKVLSIQTADQFNANIGPVVNAVNIALRTEKVEAFQKLGEKTLKQMLPKAQKVSPQAQLFAEHLMNVYRGKAPLNYDSQAADPQTQAKAVVEQAVNDLRTAGDNATMAAQALRVINSFFKENLQTYRNYQARMDATFSRLQGEVSKAVTKGVKIDAVKQALDTIRVPGKEENFSGLTFPLPYSASFMSILDGLDAASGTESMKGPLFREFNSSKPFQAWVVQTDWSKANIDGKMSEIYGKNAPAIWKGHMTEDFINVQLDDRESVDISRSAAMSLFMMAKMPRVRKDLLNMGINEAWLEDFETGTNQQRQFSPEDHAWMENVRNVLDEYAIRVGKVYEETTGKPFRTIDNYYMTMRYMYNATEDGSDANTSSLIESMLGGFFARDNVADSDHFKSRKGSARPLMLPDIYESLSSYAMDMNHFIGNAWYVSKLQAAFQSPNVRAEMKANFPTGYQAVIDEHIRHLASGSASRSSDRGAMRKFFRHFGYFGRNQLANPKSYIRQASAISAFTYVKTGDTWLGAKELGAAFLDLNRAYKTGEIRALTDTAYMKQRLAGMYDFGVNFVADMARRDEFKEAKKKGVFSKVRGAVASKTMHNIVTASARYGDRAASLIGGWAAYREMMKQTNNPEASVKAAIQAIEDTQQSLDPGRAPVAFSRSDLPNRTLTLFMRTPAIYLDTYLRTHKAFQDGRISKQDFARKMLAFHVWIPLFDYMVTAGVLQLSDWDLGEAAVYMAAGPFSYALVLGQALQALVAMGVDKISGGRGDIPEYMKDPDDPHLVTSFAKDVKKSAEATSNLMEYPDFENMLDFVESAGQVGDVTPLPTGYISRVPRGIHDLFYDPVQGMKILAGYSPYRTGERENN